LDPEVVMVKSSTVYCWGTGMQQAAWCKSGSATD